LATREDFAGDAETPAQTVTIGQQSPDIEQAWFF
jgi:hypothetical protein